MRAFHLSHRPWPRLVCRWALVCAFAATGVTQAACSDDEEGASSGLAGSEAGYERWVVYFTGELAGVEAYRKARAAGESTVDLQKKLQADAKAGRAAFVKTLGEVNGKVVEHWWLTNAVTVEVPAGAVSALKTMAGVSRVEPDRLLVE